VSAAGYPEGVMMKTLSTIVIRTTGKWNLTIAIMGKNLQK
jgi:hypothetical protein